MKKSCFFFFTVVFPIFIFCYENKEIEFQKAYQYDINGNLIGAVNGTLALVDPLNRMVEIKNGHEILVQFEYDSSDNRTKMKDATGITSYSYDDLNRLTKISYPSSDELLYEYDLANRITKIVYPNKEQVKYGYDNLGCLSSVKTKNAETIYEYDEITHLLKKERHSNGIATEYSYDSLYRVIHVSLKTSQGALLAEFHYTYDEKNNLASKEQILQERSQKENYTYDKSNRLIHVERSDSSFETFTYDAIGNILTKTTEKEATVYEYDNENRLVKANDIRYFYDSKGNLIKKSSKGREVLFQYDTNNHLIQYSDGENVVSFTYDGDGNRIAKNVNGKTYRFIYDPLSDTPRILMEYDPQGKIKTFCYGLCLDSQSNSEKSSFYHFDLPGKDLSLTSDQSGNLQSCYHYQAFGKPIIDSQKEKAALQYRGDCLDEETGLIYFKNRYYDPEIGRFISEDPFFGFVDDSQSLNPYAYCQNNPINFSDPSGLSTKGLVAKAEMCVYLPGTMTDQGKSKFGHGFWILTYADGTQIIVGRYPGQPKKNVDKKYPGTISFTWETTEEKVNAIYNSMYKGVYLGVANNCITGLANGLDVLGVVHPNFRTNGIRAPTQAYMWLEKLNNKNEFTEKRQQGLKVLSDIQNDWDDYIQCRPSYFYIPPSAASLQPDYGGVSLSTTAKLMLDLTDIVGAAFDEKKGQLILFGKKNLSLPPMNVDDFAVAVRSIYGLGGFKMEDPGICIDPRCGGSLANINYYGAIFNTAFGRTLFEADLLLKKLGLGQDNETKLPFSSSVYGYKSLFDRYAAQRIENINYWERMWFVPEEISLRESQEKREMIFNTVKMKVLTESKMNGEQQKNEFAENFAAHFTQHYDEFAKEFPVLEELKTLGKITAIVKWLKNNNVWIDLSFFHQYAPIYCATPTSTPITSRRISWAGPEKNEIKFKNGCWEITKTAQEMGFTIMGGVIYQLDQNNFFKVEDAIAKTFGQEACQSRPSDNIFEWDFISSNGNEKYRAVAQPIQKTKKVGNFKKSFIDMQFPVSGGFFLELIRTYNSFDEEDMGLGTGWEICPVQLSFPFKKELFSFNQTIQKKAYPALFVKENGSQRLFKLIGLNNEKSVVYKSDDENTFLIEDNAGEFSLSKKRGSFFFNEKGRLLKILDKNGISINFIYEGERLISINHQEGRAIQLYYDKDRLHHAEGPGGKIVYYNYTPQGDLCEIDDKTGILMSYCYDNEHHLSSICDAKGQNIWNGTYDCYHRVTEEKFGNLIFSKSFDLSQKIASIKGNNGSCLEESYDDQYQLLARQNIHGDNLKFTYQDGRPITSIDALGNETHFKYYPNGKLAEIQDPCGGIKKFAYDSRGNCIGEMDERGIGTAYIYDNNDQVIEIYRPAIMTEAVSKNGYNFVRFNKNYKTSFVYDEKGNLLTIAYPGGQNIYFKYDEHGMPVETRDSSGFFIKRTFDERSRIIKIENPTEIIEYVYDDRDHVVKISAGKDTLNFDFDLNGNLTSVEDAKGQKTSYEYDERNNLMKVIKSTGESVVCERNYFGQMTKVRLPNGTIKELLGR